MAVVEQAPCVILEWDTNFFGFRVARVCADALTLERALQIDAWCRQAGVRCLYFLSRADDADTARLAQDNDYQLVDIRVTLEHESPVAAREAVNRGVSVRPARPDDAPRLQSIVRDSHRDSRFYFDRNFPRRLGESLYETWIQISCEGYADVVFVAELDGAAVGYISCHLDGQPRVGRIGLAGVSSQARGQGVGQALVFSALDWFLRQEAQKATVVTQGRNVAAQRLYQRCGFLTQAVQLWYHKWYTS